MTIAVLVTLARGPGAGGHVKCWERFAEAAASLPAGTLDLTVYTMEDVETVTPLTEHVRFHGLPPAFGTARVPFLEQGAGHTDLASHHRRLARALCNADVLHTTDTFTFAKTARRVARRRGAALTASIHTDLPAFTAVYSREILARLTGTGWLGRRVLDDLDVPGRLGRDAGRKVARFLAACDRVLVSKAADRTLANGILGPERVSWLRRGIDLERFHPRHRDRARLRIDLGVPADRPLLLFVGRADDSKRLMTLGQAARRLIDAGHPVHVLAVGEGNRRRDLLDLLGPENATAPGALPQDALPHLYASADLFVFPSESEVSPNVVLEARACGLPVVLSARDGGARFVEKPGTDGILVETQDPAAWAAAIAPLLNDPSARDALGARARAVVERTVPTWRDVLEADLLPVWQAAAQAHGRPRS
ncbi:glycosyltransferase [Roseospira marina]|uniref:glycosyltransferase n=1 Tax=Roseospira marina TaxID=140057 RepID=UPI001830CCCF|nr:glycosyltransferase [Roseospira marina]MBB4313869.1 glycosyltransferase involved in cell wall biosynthesis [Roseospira marina]MBB5087031.1 glycosyltransferase involved in cell wall biosynthesis [Roseospira marina]